MWRGLRDHRYFRHVGERFGCLTDSIPTTSRDAIWLHAVSVGEVISSAGLVTALRNALPGARLYVSCTTLAGREVAGKKLGPITDGIFYAPFDFVWVIRRILRRLQPRLVIVMETEIWPNLWREAKRSGAGLLVVNGRISDRAFSGYQEFSWFFPAVLGLADRILVQSETDRERYSALGARPEIGGNLKYDFDPRTVKVAPEVRAWCEAASQRWIAASTMPPAAEGDPDEDDCVLDAWERLRRPGLRLVLVPRRPERFDLAAEKLKARGIGFVRRSALRGDETEHVLLLDTVGELSGLFRFADVVFMGGSLATRGGHNVLEPAAFGKPVIVGPHMENFRAIADRFLSAGALIQIAGPAELAPAVERVLRGESARTGERARSMAEAERGATDRAVRLARELFDGARPRPVVYGPLRPWLWLLSLGWRAGVFLDRTFTRRHRLSTPVISVGGLVMGGSGKTPLVRWLARQLNERGYRVAILMRGYRRESGKPVVLNRGSRVPIEITGDEGQLHLRDGYAHLGIGADRYETARRLEIEHQPDVFLLDDGFQHWRLERDLDIVVVDGVEEVFPLGRGREPGSALARADLVLEKRLEVRGWNPPVPEGIRIGAFCAIGDPESFRRAVVASGVTPTEWWVYPDHHVCSETELRKMSTQVDALVTTEKDFVKLPAGYPAHFLAVEFGAPAGESIVELIESRLPRRVNR